jgi:hypothetical protein
MMKIKNIKKSIILIEADIAKLNSLVGYGWSVRPGTY